MADPGEDRSFDENRRFDDIVRRLHAEDPGFTAAFHEPRRSAGRIRLVIGAVLCLGAILLLAFGGVTGAVLAVIPLLAGMAFALKGRG
ncbi:DUF3040 domain-containing protein [Actinoplanes sp. NPDC049316]|uniref:DUF3040 domain-containing protein n=1 Tax=Actinoplanes sp. NPDC049316 TaxID=3154727 RepID=UPI0034152F1A